MYIFDPKCWKQDAAAKQDSKPDGFGLRFSSINFECKFANTKLHR